MRTTAKDLSVSPSLVGRNWHFAEVSLVLDDGPLVHPPLTGEGRMELHSDCLRHLLSGA